MHITTHSLTQTTNQPYTSLSIHLFLYAPACVACVSVCFRSKERPRNGIPGKFFAPKPNGNACYAGYVCAKNSVFIHSPLSKREEDWSQNASCRYFWDRYWGRAGQLLAYFFPLSLVTVPEDSAKFNSAQFPVRMGQFESAREIDLVVVVPNCTMGLLLLHDAAILALTVYLSFSDSAGLPLWAVVSPPRPDATGLE